MSKTNKGSNKVKHLITRVNLPLDGNNVHQQETYGKSFENSVICHLLLQKKDTFIKSKNYSANYTLLHKETLLVLKIQDLQVSILCGYCKNF
jgi:hypothetical protein